MILALFSSMASDSKIHMFCVYVVFKELIKFHGNGLPILLLKIYELSS